MKIQSIQKKSSEPWSNYLVDQVCTLVTNGFVGTATSHYTDANDGILYIQGYNIKEGGFNFHGIKKVTKEFHKKNLKSNLKFKDLLTIQTGDCGLTSVVPKELEGANCHALIISRFKSELINPYFIYYFYNSEIGRSKLKRIETGSTMKHINVSDLKALELNIPVLPEQNRIVSVLETWDQSIEKLTKKIEIKKQIKKGLMQDLLTGKKRLGEFNEKWEIAKLGDICDLYQPHTITSEDIKEFGEYKVFGANGVIGYFDRYNHEDREVLITCRGATCGHINFSEPKSWVTGNAMVAKPKNNKIDKDYLFYILNFINLGSVITGMAQPQITRKDLAPFTLNLPKIMEQVAIANILLATDKEISKLETKVSLFRDQKAYLLNNLITGTIRTPETLSVKS